jgi:hypothetical protein
MTSGRDEYMEKRCIDYEAENRKRYKWVTETGGAAHLNLTVRDYFAVHAMQGLLTRLKGTTEVSELAYKYADEMMKARALDKQGEQ